MHKNKKACQVCGKPFTRVRQDQFYCDECLKKIKGNVYRLAQCADCGANVYLAPKSYRCYNCQKIANREAQKLFKQRGAKRSLGSIDICEICQKEYVVLSGRQKYCSKLCQDKGVKEKVSERKRKYNQRPDVKAKKQAKRDAQNNVCVYCLREFKTNVPKNTCSDFCKTEQKKIMHAYADISRGKKRNLEKYENLRKEYRKKVKTGCQ